MQSLQVAGARPPSLGRGVLGKPATPPKSPYAILFRSGPPVAANQTRLILVQGLYDNANIGDVSESTAGWVDLRDVQAAVEGYSWRATAIVLLS